MSQARSPTFCALPFVHLASKPDGSLNLCCIASSVVLKDENSVPRRMDRDSFEEIWNCSSLRKIRQQMLAGEKISGCETCYWDEAHHKKSWRLQANERWESSLGTANIEQRIAESQNNEGRLQSNPVYLDLRTGNACNLKCRMCFPLNSHSLNQEIHEIFTDGEPFPESYRSKVLENKKPLFWGHSEHFLSSIEKALPDLKELYFTGGEPMLVPGTAKILQKCVDFGVAKNIKVTFHTNGTLWNEAVVALLPHFLFVNVICSMDGAHRTDEYIRYPTDFAVVDGNFKKYLRLRESHKNIQISIGSTLSWQNVFSLPEFCQWLIDVQSPKLNSFLSVGFNLIYFPHFLSLNMIPWSLRPVAAEAILRSLHLLETTQLLSEKNKVDLSAALDLLAQAPRYTPHDSQDLVHQTTSLDKKRNQQLKDYIPLAEPVFRFHQEARRQQ